MTALHLAAEFSPIAVVEAIAQTCITLVDDEEEQCTLLHSAVLHNEVDIVRLLLDHGADVGALDRQGRMPLHYAAMYFILLENDVKVGRNSEVDIVKLLVNNQWCRRERQGQTQAHPLTLCFKEGVCGCYQSPSRRRR